MPFSIRDITRLRQHCVDAHNRIDWIGEQTLLSDVCRALEVPLDVEPRSPAHKLLSSYAFFSDAYLVVGRRRKFDDRVHRMADDRARGLLRPLRSRPFGAWQVRDRSETDEAVTAVCESVGRADTDGPHTCRLVGFDGAPPSLDADTYAGWHFPRREDHDLLLFATAIEADAAAQLRRAADEMAWMIDGEFDATEYERDVLVATAAPTELDPGADRLWFIPSHLRSVFTSRFFRFLMQIISTEGLLPPPGTRPWHLDLVDADQHDRRDEVRDRLDSYRSRAGQTAASPLVDRVDTSKIGRLASNDEILVALGADPDGHIEIDDLAGPGTQARRADDTYWLRHRWTVLMSHFHDNLDHYDDRYGLAHLKPDYSELRRILHELFADELGDLPVTDLPHDPHAQLSYVADALTDDQPPRLRDLPTGPLDEVPGIGQKRADLVYENLYELLTNWRG